MFRLRLKELRENAGYSQYTFAKKIGCAQSAVGNWESGRREPSFDTLMKIADFFNVTTDYLLGRTDRPEIHVVENPPQLSDLGVSQISTSSTDPFTPEQIEAINKEIQKYFPEV